MSGLINPHLERLRGAILEQRKLRGDAEYVDEHVKRVAVALVILEVENPEELSMDQSLEIFAESGLTAPEYAMAMSFIYPTCAEAFRHAAKIRH